MKHIGQWAAWSLMAIFAINAEAAPAKDDGGYLAGQVPDITRWLPPAPVKGSVAETEDIAIFTTTRQVLHTARGQQAADDDVYEPEQVAARFSDAAGVPLSAKNVPVLIKLIGKVELDSKKFMAPVKLDVDKGGRTRPFVAFPSMETCLYPGDMAHRRQDDIDVHHLDRTGSYPSGHAFLGMMMGLVLSEADPDHADAVMARGMEFGESRVICGFHYSSDIVAGRLAAAALFARLQADSAFAADVAAIRDELKAVH